MQEIISANDLVTVWYKQQFMAIMCSVITVANRELDLDATGNARKRKWMLNPPPFALLHSPFKKMSGLSSRSKLPSVCSSSRMFRFSLQALSRSSEETENRNIN